VAPSSTTVNDITDSGVSGHMVVDNINRGNGYYPVTYTVWEKGTYAISITSGGDHIMSSAFTLEVDDGAVFAESSTAAGNGLTGGVAGDEFAFTVQAKDVRQVEQQTVMTYAHVVDLVPEEQTVSVSGSFTLSFRGEATATISNGDSYASVEAKLEDLDQVKLFFPGSITVSGSGSGVTVGEDFDISFANAANGGHYGDLALLTCNAGCSMSDKVNGDTPFRKEIQAFQCNADGGEFTATIGSYSAITIAAADNEAAVEAAFLNDAGLSVTVAFGVSKSSVCVDT
jgi:hypothetical protein